MPPNPQREVENCVYREAEIRVILRCMGFIGTGIQVHQITNKKKQKKHMEIKYDDQMRTGSTTNKTMKVPHRSQKRPTSSKSGQDHCLTQIHN